MTLSSPPSQKEARNTLVIHEVLRVLAYARLAAFSPLAVDDHRGNRLRIAGRTAFRRGLPNKQRIAGRTAFRRGLPNKHRCVDFHYTYPCLTPTPESLTAILYYDL